MTIYYDNSHKSHLINNYDIYEKSYNSIYKKYHVYEKSFNNDFLMIKK